VGLFNVQLNEVMKKRNRKALRSLLIVTNTFLLFAGMFIAKLIPLMTTVNPLIGFGVVLAASGLIFIHKLIESIVDYREQKLVKKIDKAIEANDRLMEIAFEETVKDPNNNLIVNLKKKPSFSKSRKTREGYSIFGKPRNAQGQYSRLDNKNSEAIHLSKLG
jgi:hypothetical protein